MKMKRLTIRTYAMFGTFAVFMLIGENAFALKAGDRTQKHSKFLPLAAAHPAMSTEQYRPAVGTSSRKGVVGKAETCSDNYLPLSMFQMLLIDENPDDLVVDTTLTKEKGKRFFNIRIPRMIKNCAEWELSYEVVKGQDNDQVLLRMENKKNLEKYKDVGHSYFERYEACLIDEGVIDPATREINWSNGDIQEVVQPYRIEIKEDELEWNRPVKVAYGSPLTPRGEVVCPGGKMYDTPTAASGCFNYELFQCGKSAYVYDREEAERERYLTICRSGNSDQITSAIDELIKSNTGNHRDLLQMLQAVKSKVGEDNIKKDLEALRSKGGEIRRFQTLKKTGEGDLEELSQLAKEYIEILERLKKTYLEPKIARMRELHEEKRGASGEEKKRLQAEMKILGDEISKFAKADYIPKSVITRLEEYGLTDSAKKVAEFKASAAFYGKVGKGKSSPDQAANHLRQEMAKYDRHSEVVEKRYEARMGYDTFSGEYRQRSTLTAAQRDRSWQSYMTSLSKACSANIFGYQNNPNQCKRLQRSYSQQLAVRGKFNTRIGYYEGMAEKFSSWEAEGAERRAQDEEYNGGYGDGDPLGSGLFDYSISGIDQYSLNSGQQAGGQSMNGGLQQGSTNAFGGYSQQFPMTQFSQFPQQQQQQQQQTYPMNWNFSQYGYGGMQNGMQGGMIR